MYLNILGYTVILLVNQTGDASPASGSRCSARPMKIVYRIDWEIKHHNMIDSLGINSTRRNVCAYQILYGAQFQSQQDLLSFLFQKDILRLEPHCSITHLAIHITMDNPKLINTMLTKIVVQKNTCLSQIAKYHHGMTRIEGNHVQNVFYMQMNYYSVACSKMIKLASFYCTSTRDFQKLLSDQRDRSMDILGHYFDHLLHL